MGECSTFIILSGIKFQIYSGEINKTLILLREEAEERNVRQNMERKRRCQEKGMSMGACRTQWDDYHHSEGCFSLYSNTASYDICQISVTLLSCNDTEGSYSAHQINASSQNSCSICPIPLPCFPCSLFSIRFPTITCSLFCLLSTLRHGAISSGQLTYQHAFRCGRKL